MNPQDYPPQQQPTDQSTKAWFDNINAPIASPPPVSPKKKPRSKLLIISCAILVFALAIPAAYLYTQSTSAKMCLNAQNYKELLDIESESAIDAETNFYTATVEFDSGSSEYNELTEKDTKKLIESIGSLYKNHHEKTSIKLSISANYIYENATASATERIQKIKAALVTAGVDESTITTEKPILIPPESEYESTYDDLPARISITSEEGCKQ